MVQKEHGKSPKPRGRPPAYDAEAALRQATELFWDAGYSGTALNEIAAATGMNKPSLYAAFGDKRQLYLQVLARYWQRAFEATRQALAEDRPLAEALMRAYEASLAIYFSGDGPPRGCFVIGTAVTAALGEEEIRESLAKGVRTCDRDFTARFRAARENGELGSDADPGALGMLATATLHTIAIRARAGESRAALRELARKAIGVLCR
jgi:AcrR family transcriptional regulator